MNIIKHISRLSEENRKFTLATVVDLKGSVPGKIGFKLVIENSGKTLGTVGGGALETEVINEALERMKSGKSGLKKYVLSDNPKTENENVVPMSCNGEIEIFYEIFGNQPAVYVFGGGHVGNKLLHFLKNLDYHTILIDNREEFCNEEKNPDADEYHFSDYLDFAEKFQPEENSYAVILTHKHIYDYDIAKRIYQRNLQLKYIGIIASRSKAGGIIKKLNEEIKPEPDLSNLSIPIGLDIGGETAAEIALSIAAQIQAVKFGKDIKSLSVTKSDGK